MKKRYSNGKTTAKAHSIKNMPSLGLDALILGGRAVIIYFLVLVMVRLMGKREVGQLSPFDFVVGVMIGSVAALPMEDAQLPFLPALVPILVLTGLEILMSTLAMHNSKIRMLIEDKPTVIISDGEIIKENMTQVRMNIDDLKQELRKSSIVDINEVEEGTLERCGTFTVIKKKEHLPLTQTDLQNTTLHNLDQVTGAYALKARTNLESLLSARGRRRPVSTEMCVAHTVGTGTLSKTSASCS
ncbi:MAG: DUF421 domain-containing protein [Firmicutes bacterium]|nr:DUF421 domain-containing protein [Bacillota bacterium]